MKQREIATGFDDGKTVNSQVVSRGVIQHIPAVARLTAAVILSGTGAAEDIMKQMHDVQRRRS